MLKIKPLLAKKDVEILMVPHVTVCIGCYFCCCCCDEHHDDDDITKNPKSPLLLLLLLLWHSLWTIKFKLTKPYSYESRTKDWKEAPPPPFWCSSDWMWDFLFKEHNTNNFRSTNEIPIPRDSSPGKMWNTNFPPPEFFMTIPKAVKFFCFLSSPLCYEILQGARMELYSTVQAMSSTTDRYNWIDPTLRRMVQMCQMKQLSSTRNVAPLASAPLTRISSRRRGLLAHTMLRCLGISYETTRPCTSSRRRVTFCWFLSVTHGEGVLNQQKLVNEF